MNLLDQRVGNRQGRNSGLGSFERREQAINHIGAQSGTRGVVDKHQRLVVPLG